MLNLSKDTKRRISTVTTLAKTTFHWTFIPVVLYLGFKQGAEPGMPPLTILSLLWQWLSIKGCDQKNSYFEAVRRVQLRMPGSDNGCWWWRSGNVSISLAIPISCRFTGMQAGYRVLELLCVGTLAFGWF